MFSTPTQKCSKKDVEKVERAEDGVKTSPKFMLLQRFGYDLTTISEERDSSSPFKGSYVSEDVIQNKICSVMQQDKSYTQDAYQNMLRDCDITEQLVGNLLRGDLEEELTHKRSELYDELMAAFIGKFCLTS